MNYVPQDILLTGVMCYNTVIHLCICPEKGRLTRTVFMKLLCQVTDKAMNSYL